jgi:hypothetical protein
VPIKYARLPALRVSPVDTAANHEQDRQARPSLSLPCPVCSYRLQEKPGSYRSPAHFLGNGKFVRFHVEATYFSKCQDCGEELRSGTEAAHHPVCPKAGPGALEVSSTASLEAYLCCPTRQFLLDKICELPDQRYGLPLRHWDGTRLLEPCVVRSFLNLELWINPGVRDTTLMACTLADYLAKEAVGGENVAGFTWRVGPSEILFASPKQAEAIDAYVRVLRPSLLKSLGPAKKPDESPLFPSKGGSPLRSLAHATTVFVKLASSHRTTWKHQITPACLHITKENYWRGGRSSVPPLGSSQTVAPL